MEVWDQISVVHLFFKTFKLYKISTTLKIHKAGCGNSFPSSAIFLPVELTFLPGLDH